MRTHYSIPETILQELVAPNSISLEQLASGGLSGARVWRCQSPHGPVALRCWPAVHPSSERLGEIHAAMFVARQHGVQFVPAIVMNRRGGSFTSDGKHLWEVTQWMPGTADYLAAPSSQRLQAAMRALAKLHRTWQESPQPLTQTGLSPTIIERRQKLEYCLQQLPHWTHLPLGESSHRGLALQTMQHLAAYGPQLLPQLTSLRDQPVPLHFVLRDVWSDHVLFTNDRVTGIIDFGAARVDEPATDVARLLGSLEPFDQGHWLVGWEAYRTVNPHVELDRVRLLDRVGTLLSAVQWLQWLVLQPRAFNAPPNQLVERWQRLLRRLELNSK
ncbi:MAG: aminoglycoside phosphotransferase family protein [Planctomycetales bacterium]|nr:aminoglycoside phosphotransferase family protein [Planctomycetales bacterium]